MDKHRNGRGDREYASGNGDITETLNLPVGASVIYTVTANISAAALGSLINTATVSQVGDTDSDNDTATDIDTLDNPVSIVKIYDAAEASTNGKFRVSQAEANDERHGCELLDWRYGLERHRLHHVDGIRHDSGRLHLG